MTLVTERRREVDPLELPEPLLPNREWTVDDLEALPDDGLRYELYDGMLIVSASPTHQHQGFLLAMYRLLYAACPAEFRVFVAPLDFQPTPHRSFQPDAMVVRRDALGRGKITDPPVLVVEVLSPSTRIRDQLVKHEAYLTSGVPNYWIVDPGDPEAKRPRPASLVAYQAVDDAYRVVAKATGEETVELANPYPVTICPAELAKG